MKKRICSIVLAVLMLVCFTIPAFAADVSNTTIIDCGDGYYLKVTLTEYVPEAATRAIYQKTATSKADAYHGNTYIGTFYLNGTFQYDTVTSKATADSWSASAIRRGRGTKYPATALSIMQAGKNSLCL